MYTSLLYSRKSLYNFRISLKICQKFFVLYKIDDIDGFDNGVRLNDSCEIIKHGEY